jgi:hypothetical protein
MQRINCLKLKIVSSAAAINLILFSDKILATYVSCRVVKKMIYLQSIRSSNSPEMSFLFLDDEKFWKPIFVSLVALVVAFGIFVYFK